MYLTVSSSPESVAKLVYLTVSDGRKGNRQTASGIFLLWWQKPPFVNITLFNYLRWSLEKLLWVLMLQHSAICCSAEMLLCLSLMGQWMVKHIFPHLFGAFFYIHHSRFIRHEQSFFFFIASYQLAQIVSVFHNRLKLLSYCAGRKTAC